MAEGLARRRHQQPACGAGANSTSFRAKTANEDKDRTLVSPSSYLERGFFIALIAETTATPNHEALPAARSLVGWGPRHARCGALASAGVGRSG